MQKPMPDFPARSKPITRILLTGLTVLAILAALGYLIVYVYIAARRMGYPYELEWIEGGFVGQVGRILAGQPVYGPPSIEFTPFIYTPLYFYLSAATAKIVGAGFLPLRIVSVLSSLVAIIGIFALVFRRSRNLTASFIAAGLLGRLLPDHRRVARRGAGGFTRDRAAGAFLPRAAPRSEPDPLAGGGAARRADGPDQAIDGDRRGAVFRGPPHPIPRPRALDGGGIPFAAGPGHALPQHRQRGLVLVLYDRAARAAGRMAGAGCDPRLLADRHPAPLFRLAGDRGGGAVPDLPRPARRILGMAGAPLGRAVVLVPGADQIRRLRQRPASGGDRDRHPPRDRLGADLKPTAEESEMCSGMRRGSR